MGVYFSVDIALICLSLRGADYPSEVTFESTQKSIGADYPSEVTFESTQKSIGADYPSEVTFESTQKSIGADYPSEVTFEPTQKSIGADYPSEPPQSTSQSSASPSWEQTTPPSSLDTSRDSLCALTTCAYSKPPHAFVPQTPLPPASVNIAVFCLSLMGADYPSFLSEAHRAGHGMWALLGADYLSFLSEAHRVLQPGGSLIIAEVRSRFDPTTGGAELKDFVAALKQLGFRLVSKV
ncbi:unnamed protein product [Closterium sp. NIES-65]|nr:unnamed protein product [Closterium sp. NIES-65]